MKMKDIDLSKIPLKVLRVVVQSVLEKFKKAGLTEVNTPIFIHTIEGMITRELTNGEIFMVNQELTNSGLIVKKLSLNKRIYIDHSKNDIREISFQISKEVGFHQKD